MINAVAFENLSELEQKFTRWIEKITYTGEELKWNNIVLKIDNNPYQTILNKGKLNLKERRAWEHYIQNIWDGGVDSFNNFIENRKNVILRHQRACYLDEERFNLYCAQNENLSYDIYAKIDHSSKQLKQLANTNDIDASRKIFNYLKIGRQLRCLKYVAERRAFNELTSLFASGYNRLNIKPVTISNSPDVWCYNYISLDFRKGAYPTWNLFMKQFEHERHQNEFQAWIFSIFLANDYDRRVLWLEGDAKVGKSTVINVLCDFLRSYDSSLVCSMVEFKDRNQFSLTGLDNSRLVVFSNACNNDARTFFIRRDLMTLTGNDYVSYQEKNRNPEAKKIYSKVIVSSNFAPEINETAKYQTSRLLRIKIKRSLKYIEGFANKLAKELPSFLAGGKEIYEKRRNQIY